jgi:hypothetical protein
MQQLKMSHRLTAYWGRWCLTCLTFVTSLTGGLVLGVAASAAAQTPPPINGVTGTVAVEGTVKNEYGAANTIVVGTIDGVEHVFHFAKGFLVHGTDKANLEGLKGLRAGTTVVVHYTTEGATQTVQEIDRVGDRGLKTTEGVVTRVDRGRKQITVRFDSGTTETLQLTDRAAADVGKDVDGAVTGATRIAVYYTDEAGHKVVHYFRRR